jgi:hypothetical protein
MIFDNPAELKERIAETIDRPVRSDPRIFEDTSSYMVIDGGSVLRRQRPLRTGRGFYPTVAEAARSRHMSVDRLGQCRDTGRRHTSRQKSNVGKPPKFSGIFSMTSSDTSIRARPKTALAQHPPPTGSRNERLGAEPTTSTRESAAAFVRCVNYQPT